MNKALKSDSAAATALPRMRAVLAAVADRLKCGFVPIRKKGKLPWKTTEAAYELEYGEAVVEISP